ncbi:GNAT family N-acetyltransferase [Leucobacter insecticola]|uniref:GNAT family N-acetyltransferase n=1 Tax=Leucobacter insecticola TaxID=2714934 RepID=A0A6G8FJN9_9MICO|nr:GNAT family N-acetyltransferase [Leucobacter insecticola]QIM16680.1 GNAT family N-acetyltransferase [Leucobacter insecticola]
MTATPPERLRLAEEVLNSRFAITKFKTGYSLDEVDEFLDVIVAMLKSPAAIDEVLQTLSATRFSETNWRDGYQCDQVDAFIENLMAQLRTPSVSDFQYMIHPLLIETPRLQLREMTAQDLPALKAILQDDETMAAYEGAFDDEMVQTWFETILTSYRDNRFGMWAVILRETGEMIGQCGPTRQQILGQDVIEIGYLFNRAHWHQGFAIEAAHACRHFAFDQLNQSRVYAQVRDTNIASMNVAIRMGMTVRGRFDKEYRGVVMPHFAFALDRPEGHNPAPQRG